MAQELEPDVSGTLQPVRVQGYVTYEPFCRDKQQDHRTYAEPGNHEPNDAESANQLRHHCRVARMPRFQCETGQVIFNLDVVYETWGELNAARDNAVVVCHALTGDAHAGPSTLGADPSDGWWQGLIGPGKALDPEKYFVICSNVLGGCSGTTGPSSIAPDGIHYGLRFPLVSIRDMVRAQINLIDSLGVEGVELVIGGSLGGMQVWEWLIEDCDRVKNGIVMAAHAAFPPLAIGYNAAMRKAITSDPAWQQGDYYGGQAPTDGLALARTIGMLTYRAGGLYDVKFERRQTSTGLSDAIGGEGGIGGTDGTGGTGRQEFTRPVYEVESYLAYNGEKFVKRFDANSYLYLTKAMDGHDIGRARGGLDAALAMIQSKTTVVGINSDYLYQSSDLAQTVARAEELGAPLTYLELDSPHGHDAFLIEYDMLNALVSAHLGKE
ncbi:homoserine O-acetyltransferase MetX [Alicyclobacillus ferrooxydans]|nr:homoserine O-acetyltransferase [Alicyclobacillus ferrooxydans]